MIGQATKAYRQRHRVQIQVTSDEEHRLDTPEISDTSDSTSSLNTMVSLQGLTGGENARTPKWTRMTMTMTKQQKAGKTRATETTKGTYKTAKRIGGPKVRTEPTKTPRRATSAHHSHR